MKRLFVCFSLCLCLPVLGQDIDSELSNLTDFIRVLNNFSINIPQEKAYLHFDNTSYYQGDNIWFKCYVVTSGQHQLSPWSKTLYVELLNPGGEIVDKRILKIDNGQCHGEFTLNQLPFYSGFYEVRAYTKYMLNFGEDVIFSRLLPVFDKPKAEGNFEEKDMQRYGRWGVRNYPMKRESPVRGNSVNLRFFPEGGNLIQGVASQVAFEATDETGNPIDVSGVLMDGNRQELCQITTLHEGKGVFTYMPGVPGRRNDVAEVEYSGRKYRFDLPASLPQGVVMETDNLSHPDNIFITLHKNRDTPAEILGLAVLNGGKLQNAVYAYIADEEISLTINKTRLPAGVSQIVLFNSKGEILCDRLVFTNLNELLDIRVKTCKPSYRPYELVDMEISVTDKRANLSHTTFSLSVRDGTHEVENHHTILTDLLLMSEIKGYVRNPSYYFEDDDDTRRAALDVLLMVQGWRRYSWEMMTNVETWRAPSLPLKYLPEQGIETHGTIIHHPLFGKPKPRPSVDVELLLLKRGEAEETGEVGETGGSLVETFVTDNDGRFAFASDVQGRWNMILAVKENGKRKNHQILLDRVFSPEPSRYRYADLQVNIAENNSANMIADEEISDDNFENNVDLLLTAYQDSLAKLGVDEKIHHLSEVTVTAKRTKEQDIFHNRSTSVAYYDVHSEMDDLYDSGKFIGDDIHQILINMNENFSVRYEGNLEFLYYKQHMALFVVNYQPIDWSVFGYFQYKPIRPSVIKSIYINEDPSVIEQYIIPSINISPMMLVVNLPLSCVVFIETYPEGEIPVEGAKGVRKTWLEGYSMVKEFYSPNYSELPMQLDHRRTLYWNPMVTPDEKGIAQIQFYNNSGCKNFRISAETITPVGTIGIFRKGYAESFAEIATNNTLQITNAECED